MPTVGVFAAVADEYGRLLCVKSKYGDFEWTAPGGRMEPGETPLDTLHRVVREESGYRVSPLRLLGVYSAPYKDDLVLFFEARIEGEEEWFPTDEISAVGFFAPGYLPEPFSPSMARRFDDFLNGVRAEAQIYVLEEPDPPAAEAEPT